MLAFAPGETNNKRVAQFFIENENIDELREDHLDEIAAGRVWVAAAHGEPIALGADCELIVVHPLTTNRLPFKAVVASIERKSSGARVELKLQSTGPKRRQSFEAFLTGKTVEECSVVESPREPSKPNQEESLILELIHSPESAETMGLAPSMNEHQEKQAPCETLEEEPPVLELEAVAESPIAPSNSARHKEKKQQSKMPLNVHQRVRKLTAPEREKLARTGTQAERVALERAFGSTLWEAILSNPQVSPPEVAKIAKNRTASAPILQIIVGHQAWLSRPEVKRGLLSNTRLQAGQIERVLRTLNRTELKEVQRQTAYPQRVRQAVSKLLGPS